MSAAPERLTLWRDGGLNRVVAGAASGFAGGASYAYLARAAPSPLRAGVACAMLAAPFFAVREVVAASMRVDGRVASAVSGGVVGYFGALFTMGPCWKAISRSAMLVGVGCGFVDVVVSAVDWKRKLYLLRSHDDAVRAAAAAADGVDAPPSPPPSHASPPWAFKWPYWLPVVKQIDDEYEELLRRQRATVQALEEEQARIALLLNALERVKAGKQVTDVELADAAGARRSACAPIASPPPPPPSTPRRARARATSP